MRELSGSEQENFDAAVTLAYEAGTFFNLSRTLAKGLAQKIDKIGESDYPADDGAYSEVHDGRDHFAKQFAENYNKFKLHQDAAAMLMPSRLALEAEPEQPFMSPEVAAAMSLEQRGKAVVMREAVVSKFRPYGVRERDLRVVRTESPQGEPVFTLVDAGEGLKAGDPQLTIGMPRDYMTIMAPRNKEFFTVTLNEDGSAYDMRSGMTTSVYDALINDAQDRGLPLPGAGSYPRGVLEGHTCTMLTGESHPRPDLALYSEVNNGHINGFSLPVNKEYPEVVIRLAVIIE